MEDRRELDQRTRDVLETLFGEEAERIARSYPHQLSGGQRQHSYCAGDCLWAVRGGRR